MKILKFRPLIFSIAILTLIAGGLITSVRTHAETVTVVATGLHNPRKLNFAPNGLLYVAEAAGNGPNSGLCGLVSDGSIKCSARTSSITQIDLAIGSVTRFISSLPSLIPPNGPAIASGGADDVSFDRQGNGYFTIGLAADPRNRVPYFGQAGLRYARLARFDSQGNVTLGPDLGAFEVANNPDGELIDSNPYGLLVLPGRIVYVDAGGNTLNEVTPDGTITNLAVFPRAVTATGLATLSSGPPSLLLGPQAVPTSVALGPDGNFYVSQLTGAPFQVGTAYVFRVPPQGGYPFAVYGGFTNIVDIAFGPDGSFYVLEIAKNAIPNFFPGRLVRIAPNGTRTELAANQLTAPGGIAVGSDGALYVTNLSIFPDTGQVLKIVP